MKFKLFTLMSLLCLAFFSFGPKNGNYRYEMVNDKVIKRTDLTTNTYALYQKGKVVLKFKTYLNVDSDGKHFGISKLDNIINDYNVSSSEARYKIPESRKASFKNVKDIENVYTIKYDSNIDPYTLAEKIMQENSDVLEFADVDMVYEMDYIPNDPNINGQYHIGKISAFGAWDFTKGDTNVVIGIVDSGSDLDHPDLAANIKYNYADPVNGIDDDNNGYIDDWRGWDFIGNGSAMDNDPNVFGNNCNHGSHVSGCASQVTDNGVHGAGIGFKCKLLISKHGDDDDFSGEGGTSLIYNSDQGIYYCTQMGVEVINCSFGSSFFSGTTNNMIQNAWANGVIVCASAGNQNTNAPRYPAAYDNAVSVAATNSADLKASFSNFHSSVDISAPGDGIVSTLWNNTYAAFSGTSMSSPVTAGTVALIRSKNPSWAPQQVVDRLKSTVDSIYHLNPSFVGLLGTGRVNALKAMTDLPIISILSSSSSDSLLGNNDKSFGINEQVTIQLNMKNIWQGANDCSIRLTTTDPDVEIVKDSIYVGNIGAYATFSTSLNNTFIVKAKSSCPFDKTVTFRLSASSSTYTDFNTSAINVKFRLGWVTHDVNNMLLSLTKDGAIGKKSEPYGNGLTIQGVTGNNIFEGGLMIANSNTKVMDNCRSAAAGNVSDTDFVGLTGYDLKRPGDYSSQDGRGFFNDNGAGSNKIGLEVDARSFAFSAATDANYIILRYRVRNTSGVNLTNLYAGTYIFFQPGGVIGNNTSTVNTESKLGYTFNSNVTLPYLGVSLLTEQTLNFKPINGTDIINGFTTDEKWQAMSNGVTSTPLGPGLNAIVVSAGPFNLDAGAETIVSFAILKGTTLVDLLANANLAKIKYGTISVGIQQISSVIPDKFDLSQNYPNPFNPSTIINFAIAKQTFATLNVYDITGRLVSQLVNQELQPGNYQYTWNGSGLSSGAYFYRLQTNEFTNTKRMLLVK